MVASPSDDAVRLLAYGGFLNIEDNLRLKLGMVVNGIAGRSQLAQESTPSILVLCDRASVVDAVLEGLLYGCRVGHMGRRHVRWSERRPDGRWSPGRQDFLSAVGLFQTRLGVEPRRFDLYLCPNPKHPLSAKFLGLNGVSPWELAPDGVTVRSRA